MKFLEVCLKIGLRLFGVVIFFTAFSYAAVAPGDWRPPVSWLDLRVSEGERELQVLRVYDPAFPFHGPFGPGWCLKMDARLLVVDEQSLSLMSCGHAQSELFKMTDSGSSDFKHDGVIYYSGHKAKPDGERIILRDGKYVRYLLGGGYQQFDSGGRLVFQQSAKGGRVYISYENDQIKKVVDDRAGYVLFRYDQQGRLVRIVASSEVTAEYKFGDEGLLQEVTNAWNNSFDYQYDKRNHLIKVVWNKKREDTPPKLRQTYP